MDLTIFRFIHAFAHYSKVLDRLGIFVAKYLQYALAGFLLALLFSQWQVYQPLLFEALLAGLFSRFVIKFIITLFVQRPRPFVALSSAKKLITTWSFEDQLSFPSGHALFFFALSTTFFLSDVTLGMVFYFFSTLIAVARVFTGVHWPSDVLAGAFLGVFGALIVHVF